MGKQIEEIPWLGRIYGIRENLTVNNRPEEKLYPLNEIDLMILKLGKEEILHWNKIHVFL